MPPKNLEYILVVKNNISFGNCSITFSFTIIHFSLVIVKVIHMRIMYLQGAWINYLHLFYLRMQLRLHAFLSSILKQNLLILP
jgi:hypothetical protein